MRERAEQILKIVCVALAVLLLVQLVKAAVRMNPLSGVVVPQLPSLPADTNAPAMAVKAPIKAGTNSVVLAVSSKTNLPLALADTNIISPPKIKSASNAAPIPVVAETIGTNSTATNVATAIVPNARVGLSNVVTETNISGGELARAGNTNSVAVKKSGAKKSEMAVPPIGMMPPGMMPPGKKAVSLPPDIQARVDRVTDSEILGPVIRPMPMALLGIAGNSAFLRSPSGQTGLVKEGDTLGEIKLLRIGVNRVLVEQDGQKKELMIFSGFGGESLLPKSTDTSDETTKN